MKTGKVKKAALWMFSVVCAILLGLLFLMQDNVSAAGMGNSDDNVSTNAMIEPDKTQKEAVKETEMIEEAAAMQCNGTALITGQTQQMKFMQGINHILIMHRSFK